MTQGQKALLCADCSTPVKGRKKRCPPCSEKAKRVSHQRRNLRHYQGLKGQKEKYEQRRLALKSNHHKRVFNLTDEEYEKRFESQNGLCACCGQPEQFLDKRSGLPKSLAVDHNHSTGHVRALLCHACNVSFGLLEENQKRIQMLLEYAQRVQK